VCAENFRTGEEEKMCSDLWAEQPKPGQAAVGYITLDVKALLGWFDGQGQPDE
jgi:hypothetical protein